MRILAITLGCALVQSASAQTYPVELQNIPFFGPIAYQAPGSSFGPISAIEDPLAEADLWGYAAAFWTEIDTNGAAGLSQTGWTWTAPNLTAFEDPNLRANAQVDVWNGGYELFEYLYQHRLAPGGVETFYELCLADPVVALTFKHYTLTHQVATWSDVDPIAHQRHIDIVIDGLTVQSYAESRGVPMIAGTLIVSDRTEIVHWNSAPAARFAGGGGSGSNFRGDGTTSEEMQDCIDMKKRKLAGQGLYKNDKAGGIFGSGADPGFDCDDFADAIGAFLVKDKEGASYSQVGCTFRGGNKKKGSHAITRIDAGGQYWLVDGQTGLTSGPHNTDVPMDASSITEGGYGAQDGTTNTNQSTDAPNDRSWGRGLFGNGEPDPWHTDPEERRRFEDKTGESPECFIQS